MTDTSKLSDEKLIEVVRSKDNESYAEVIRRYQAKLLRYATYIVGNDEAGADIVQDSFIKSFQNLNGFDTKKKFSSWIYRIVHNEAINYLKKQSKTRELNPEIEYDSGVNLEEEFIKNEIINHAQNCLEEMDLKYKTPLSLFYLEEKSYEEISDILRIPVSTVGTRINRAKLIMKKICQKNSK
jgi:RNA polymerase sigma-70 factor (ECF subfamily)